MRPAKLWEVRRAFKIIARTYVQGVPFSQHDLKEAMDELLNQIDAYAIPGHVLKTMIWARQRGLLVTAGRMDEQTRTEIDLMDFLRGWIANEG